MVTNNEKRLNDVRGNARLSETKSERIQFTYTCVNVNETLRRIYGEDDVDSCLKESFLRIYGDDNYSDDISEDLYGEFMPEENEQCLCGYGVCDIHKIHTIDCMDMCGLSERFTLFEGQICDCELDCDCKFQNEILQEFETIHEYSRNMDWFFKNQRFEREEDLRKLNNPLYNSACGRIRMRNPACLLPALGLCEDTSKIVYEFLRFDINEINQSKFLNDVRLATLTYTSKNLVFYEQTNRISQEVASTIGDRILALRHEINAGVNTIQFHRGTPNVFLPFNIIAPFMQHLNMIETFEVAKLRSVDEIHHMELEDYDAPFIMDCEVQVGTLDFTEDQRYFIDLAEDIWLMFENIYTTHPEMRIRGTINAVLSFIKMRTKRSLFDSLEEILVDRIGSYFIEVQSSPLENARFVFNSFEQFLDSPIFNKIYRCAMFGLTFSLFSKLGVDFDSLGYTRVESQFIRKKFSSRTEFMRVAIDTCLFVLERGLQVYHTGDINTIFHSSKTYDEIYEKTRLLKRQSLLLSNPEIHGFTESQFRSDLDAVIEKLQSAKKYSCSLNSLDKKLIASLLDEMCMLRDDLNCKANARQSRKAPFSLLLFGDSGIGKSYLTEMIYKMICGLKNLNPADEFKFTRNPKTQYWNGYTSSCHTIILDDVAAENPSSVSGTSSVDEIIQIINNAPFCPDQAALEDKGRTPMRAKVVIATTNVKNLNAMAYYTCPSAVQRRFPFVVTPTVRKEFLDENGRLDSIKVPKVAYPDVWTFKVEKVIATKIDLNRSIQHVATYSTILENADMRTFLKWLRDAVRNFDEEQSRVNDCLSVLKEEELCMCCSLPDSLCETRVQDGVVRNAIGGFLWGFLHLLCLDAVGISVFIFFTAFWDTIPIFMFRMFLKFLWLCVTLKSPWKAKIIIMQDIIRGAWAKNRFGQIGRRVQDVVTPLRVAHFAKIIAGLWLLKKILYPTKVMEKVETQGNEMSRLSDVGKMPVAEISGREAVWYNNEVQLAPADFTRESASAKASCFTDFLKRLSSNVIVVQIKREETIHCSRALCVSGQIYVSNAHTMHFDGDSTEMCIISNTLEGLDSNWRGVISKTDMILDYENDLCFFVLRNIPPKKNISKYFLEGFGAGSFNGSYISRSDVGEVEYQQIKNARYTKNVGIKILEKNQFSDRWIMPSQDQTTNDGFCGSPLVIETPSGYAIVGIHVACNFASSTLVASSIGKKYVETMMRRFEQFTIQSGDLSLISSKTKERGVTNLHEKSVFRYINNGVLDIYGSFTGYRGKTKSCVEKTPMNEYLMKKGYITKFTAPVMKGWVPWMIAAKDLVCPVTKIRSDILYKCANSYFGDVMKKIDQSQISEMVHILDNFTAINGAQVAYIDKINRNTSAGNPWKKSKKYFIEACPPAHGMLDPVKVDDEIMDRVEDILLRYSRGERAHPNFCAHLKDEPVSFKKAKIGKTRVFTGAPFDWCIVVRKYLLGFTRLLQNNRIPFESAPGTIAQSLEWEELYHHIAKFGDDRIVAGDFKAFDKRMAATEILMAFEVIKMFCSISGNYSPDDLRVIDCIARDTAFAVVDYNGDLVQLYGSNPSGNPLTVILNSIVNCLRMRYAYYTLNPNEECETFSNNVSLMTYGDDNIMSINKECEFFDHTKLQEALAELDIEYTMADKEAESVPFIHIDEASFLKRTWRYDEDVGALLAPLDEESVEKSLMVWNRSKTICKEAQGVAIISTAVREYFFYGRAKFEEKSKLFKKMIEELGWQIYVEESTFPTFDELLISFRKTSKHCATYQEKDW